jgi:hypothetical protein
MTKPRRVERRSAASLTLLACLMLVLLLTTITSAAASAAGSEEHTAIGKVEARSASFIIAETNVDRHLESNSSNPDETNNSTETTDDVESHGEEEEQVEEHEEPANAILFPFFTMVVGVAVFYLLTRW